MSGDALLEGHRSDVTRRALLRGLGAGSVLALGGLPAACAQDSGSGPDGDQDVEGEATPQAGGTLRVGAAGVPVPADYFAGNALGQHVATWVQFAWPLFLPSATESEPVNALAEAYEVAADGRTHTVTLRSGLTFHSGAPIDAEAVAENVRSQLFADHPLRDTGGYLTALAFGFPSVAESVDVVDDLTLQVHLTQPRVDLRKAMWYFFILDPAIMAQEEYGTDAAALGEAGSGPFRVTSFSPNAFVELERADGFFADVLLDRLRFENVEEGAALGLALRGGEVDVALGLPKDEYEALAADPAYTTFVGSRPTKNVFFWWAQSPRTEALEDPRVREAIWLAMNRDTYREAFFPEGTALPSTQPATVPGSRLHNPELEDKPYDPERARQLLAEAGFENVTVKIATPPSYDLVSDLPRLYEAIGQDLAAVGIELELSVTDDATASSSDRDFHLDFFDDEDEVLLATLFFMGFEGGFQLPDPRGHPDVARLFEAAATAADPDEQASHLRELMQLNHEEVLMGIPLADIAVSAVARQGVHDFRVAMTADPLHEAWVDG